MKMIKKILFCVMVAILFVGIIKVPIFASTLLQDGLEVTLVTDQEEYSQDEKIEATLTVKNTNKNTVENITLENLIPEGYQLAEGSLTTRKVDSLSADETIELKVVYCGENVNIQANNNEMVFAPNTGDKRNIILLPILFVLISSGVILLFIFKKDVCRKLLALFLCLIMSISLFSVTTMSVYAEESKFSTINIEHTIRVDHIDMMIKGRVTYPNLNNSLDEQDSLTNVELDTSLFEYHKSDDGDFFTLSNVITSISGIATNIDNIKSLKYSITDKEDRILKEGPILVDTAWSVSEIGFGYGYNVVTIYAELEDNSNIDKKYYIVNENIENVKGLGIDVETDNDNDGIPDYFEELVGLNASTPDTDGDGLPDDLELFASDISPFEMDSNHDGIPDGSEDSDGDGLTNLEEYRLGTSFSNADTDGDGLSDGDEVLRYYTNPLLEDTDGDGLNDAKEEEIGSDPLSPESSFDCEITYLESEEAVVIPTVQIQGLSAEQVEQLSISEVRDGMLADSQIPGYIDAAYSFSEIGEFDTAEIQFEIAPDLFESEEFKPAIYWFDEENQLLEKVGEQNINGNIISATVTHFSKYIVLDSNKYDKVWEYELLYRDDVEDVFQGIDVVFVLDSSGSMSWNDPTDNRKTVTKGFIDHLTQYDLAAVVDFDQNAVVYSDFTNDTDELYAAVDKIDSNGGTDLSAGIYEAVNLFSKNNYNGINRLKYIIMLTDGDGSYNDYYTAMAEYSGIIICTVGLGDEVSTDVLTSMSEQTGGRYYHADKADELNDIFELIADESDLAKDSDNDGICDYYEKEIASGNLRLGTGVSLLGLNYLLDDTDQDGLKDGEEIAIRKEGDRIYVSMKSNPVVIDTDQDGIEDQDDAYPLVPDISSIVLFQSKRLEGKDESGNDMHDLSYNDKDYWDLLGLGPVFVTAAICPEALMWAEFDTLFYIGRLTADSQMKNAVNGMVGNFKSGTGEIYSNSDLTDAVKKHDNVKKTTDAVKKFVANKLSANNANLLELTYNPNSNITKEYGNTIPKAYFTQWDSLSGFAITIHDFHGFTVTIKDFKKEGNKYSGTIHFHYYDHFGLDEDDEINHFGFCDWYTLQHYRRFNGAYKPFLTYVDFDVPFEGTY